MSFRNLLIMLVTLAYTSACSSYIDAIKDDDKLPVSKGLLTIYPDSNIFIYRTNVLLTKDTEQIHPKSFKIVLPKKIRYYEVVGSTDFVFYYDNLQAIMIRINLEADKSTMLNATSYVPSDNEINQIIQTKLSLGESKYDIQEIPSKRNRKHLVSKEGDVIFLLYNIQPKNYSLFVKSIKTFSWL